LKEGTIWPMVKKISFWRHSNQTTAAWPHDWRQETPMILAHPRMLELLRDESGQDLIEYGLILAVMALALIASMNKLTNTIGNFFNTVGNTL
jgi:pilus assembly protein Flp/PilA